MINILIIGCGNLGKRYIQSIDTHMKSYNINLLLVDPYTDFTLIKLTNHKSTSFKDITNIPTQTSIDLAIVTTCADIRYKITKSLIDLFTIKYLILEKVLFQKEKHYHDMLKIFKENNIKVWVNTPRRTYDFYKNLKQQLNGDKITMEVTGANWGMACNSIHFIDLFCYLNDDYNIDFTPTTLQLLPCKRPGFSELVGKYKNKNNTLSISCNQSTNFSLKKIIKSPKFTISIDNIGGTLHTTTGTTFKTPYLSNHIYKFIKQIIDTNDCDLAKYENSMKIHIPMINLFNDTFKSDVCKIT